MIKMRRLRKIALKIGKWYGCIAKLLGHKPALKYKALAMPLGVSYGC